MRAHDKPAEFRRGESRRRTWNPALQTLPAGLEKSSNRAHNYGLGVAVVKARGNCAFIVRFAIVVWLLTCHFHTPLLVCCSFLPPDGEILIAPRELPVISNRFF